MSPPQNIGDVMGDLYGDAAIPTADWHLMKQLFGRASAIVHEGGASQEMALWIWLGTRGVAELVVSAEALAMSTAPAGPEADRG